MTAGLVRPAEPQCDPPGQQVHLRRLHRVQPVEPGSQLAGGAEQRCGPPALGEAGAEHQEPGVSLPPVPVLGAEQAAGRLGAGQGHLGLLRRECGGRRGQQQFRLLGGLAADPLEILDGLLRLAQRVAGQTRREQHRAPVQAEVGQRHLQRRVAPGRLIQAAQRRGEIAGTERDDGPVVHQVGGFDLLVGPGEQPLGRSEIVGRPPGTALGQVDQGPGGQRAARPDDVPGPAQRGHRPVQVAERLRVAAQGPEHDGPAMQDAGRPDAAGLPPGLVERGQPGAGPAGVGQRDPEGGARVRLAGGRPGLLGGPHRGPQFDQGRVQVTELTQHHPGGMVCDRRLQRFGPAGQYRPGPRQPFAGAGGGEGQQFRRLGRLRCFYLVFNPHGADARSGLFRRLSHYGA